MEALLLEDLQEIEQNSWIINLSLVDGVMVQDAVGVVKPAQMFILHSALSPDRNSLSLTNPQKHKKTIGFL